MQKKPKEVRAPAELPPPGYEHAHGFHVFLKASLMRSSVEPQTATIKEITVYMNETLKQIKKNVF